MSNVQLTGTDAAEFSVDLAAGSEPCGVLAIPINGASSCTVGVRFATQSDGSKTANLTISSDDPDEGTVNVALSGIGTAVPSGGGGGGGCTVRSNAPFDPLLPIFIVMAVIYLWRHNKVEKGLK